MYVFTFGCVNAYDYTLLYHKIILITSSQNIFFQKKHLLCPCFFDFAKKIIFFGHNSCKLTLDKSVLLWDNIREE